MALSVKDTPEHVGSERVLEMAGWILTEDFELGPLDRLDLRSILLELYHLRKKIAKGLERIAADNG